MSEVLGAIADARARMNSALVRKAWDDDEFRRRLVADPKDVLAELLGRPLPEGLAVSVHEEDAGSLHFVIPAKPHAEALEQLSDADLERVVGGKYIIDDIFIYIWDSFIHRWQNPHSSDEIRNKIDPFPKR
jgi:hypothetical protein